MANISFEEKIDYIYKELKAQKRSRLFKLILKLAIIWLIITLLNSVNKEQIIDQAVEYLWNIVKPITKDIVNDMIKNNDTKSISDSLINELKNNTDLINNFKKNDY